MNIKAVSIGSPNQAILVSTSFKKCKNQPVLSLNKRAADYVKSSCQIIPGSKR